MEDHSNKFNGLATGEQKLLYVLYALNKKDEITKEQSSKVKGIAFEIKY